MFLIHEYFAIDELLLLAKISLQAVEIRTL